MRKKLLSLVIPISGEITNLQNLTQSVENVRKFELEVDVILLFDEKNSHLSNMNWLEISSWKYENVKTYRQSFSSVGAARSFGISRTNSTWIAFTDADDLILADNFVSMIHVADLEDAEVAIGGFNSVDVRSGKILITNRMNLNHESFQTVFGLNPGIWRCAFKVDSLKEVDFPDLNMAEDQVFLSRYFDLERRICFSNNIVYHYFVGDNNSLTNKVEEIVKISQALPISMSLAQHTKGPYLLLLESLAISQILSGIKYGSKQTRFSSLLQLSRFLSEGHFHRAIKRLQVINKIAKR